MSHRLTVLTLAALTACAASAARADVSYNFEGVAGLSAFTIDAGVTQDSTIFAPGGGSKSMYVAPGGHAYVPISPGTTGGTLTLQVYDSGAWVTQAVSGNRDGWRFGVSGAPDAVSAPHTFAGIVVDQRTYANSQNYSFSGGSGGDGLGGFFSPFFDGDNSHGTARQVVSLSPTSDDSSRGVGEWTTWQFNFDGSGNVVYFMRDQVTGLPGPEVYETHLNDQGSPASPVPVASFFVYGGSTLLDGVYVDNVKFVSAPEPASLSLLGLAGTGLLLRRRRHA